MIALALIAVLSASSQEPQPASSSQATPEINAIRAACAKLADAPSYTFRHLSLDEGSFGGGFGRGGRVGGEGATDPSGAASQGQPPAGPPAQPAPVPVEFVAHVQKDQPVHFQQGALEAWRQQGVLVWRNASGAWERMDMQSMRGGGRSPASEGQTEEEMRSMRTRMGLFSAQAAHELVSGFESKIAMCARTEEGGKSVYQGTLTPEGAASMGGSSRFNRGGRGGGQGGAAGGAQGGAAGGGQAREGGNAPAFQNSGSFKIVVDAQGRIESFTMDTLMSGVVQDQPIERKRHVEYRFSAVGETKLEVPAEVTAKFSEKASAGGLEF